MFSKRSIEGEILIDHRASPGMTRAEVGLDVPAVGRGEVYESPTLVCRHCQMTIVLEPKRTRERTWCAKCDRYICDDCAVIYHKTLECLDMERTLDTIQNELERDGTSPTLVLLFR